MKSPITGAVATNIAGQPDSVTFRDGLSVAIEDEFESTANQAESRCAHNLATNLFRNAAAVCAAPYLQTRMAAQVSAATPTASLLHRLPAELRLMIYELVVTPDIVAAHVAKNRLPTLLQINGETTEDFANYYYSDKVFNIELHIGTPRTREKIRDPAVIRAMFEVWECGSINCRLTNTEMFKASVERLSHVKPIESFTMGTLTWTGGPENQGVLCSYRAEARNRRSTGRADGLRRRCEFRRTCEARLRRYRSLSKKA